MKFLLLLIVLVVLLVAISAIPTPTDGEVQQRDKRSPLLLTKLAGVGLVGAGLAGVGLAGAGLAGAGLVGAGLGAKAGFLTGAVAGRSFGGPSYYYSRPRYYGGYGGGYGYGYGYNHGYYY